MQLNFVKLKIMAKRFRLEDFLPFRLNLLAQEVSQRLSDVYSERFGLDIPQWRILANLATRGDMTAQDIVKVTLNHKSTISRAVAELEDRNLIARSESKTDKRSFRLRITAKGQRLFDELLPLVMEFEHELLSLMKKDERLALEYGLAALEREVLKRGGNDR